MNKDPALQKLLRDAQTSEAQERMALIELISNSLRIEVAGIDVTEHRGPPQLEPELLAAASRGKRKKR